MRTIAARAVLPVKFALVGILNTAVDIGVFSWLVYVAGFVPALANVVGYTAGTLNSFVLNRNWTFAATERRGTATRQLARFIAVNVAALSISTLALWAFSQMLPVLAAKAVATVASFLVNFWGARRLVFG
jgi:putative flippase GtrA